MDLFRTRGSGLHALKNVPITRRVIGKSALLPDLELQCWNR
jgi:hypothetical protein